VVPSAQQDKPIVFIHAAATHYSSCNFSNALVKHPGESWTPLTWLNESHVDLNMTYVGILLFGVSCIFHLQISANLDLKTLEDKMVVR
jgi:hypothetical protein